MLSLKFGANQGVWILYNGREDTIPSCHLYYSIPWGWFLLTFECLVTLDFSSFSLSLFYIQRNNIYTLS